MRSCCSTKRNDREHHHHNNNNPNTTKKVFSYYYYASKTTLKTLSSSSSSKVLRVVLCVVVCVSWRSPIDDFDARGKQKSVQTLILNPKSKSLEKLSKVFSFDTQTPLCCFCRCAFLREEEEEEEEEEEGEDRHHHHHRDRGWTFFCAFFNIIIIIIIQKRKRKNERERERKKNGILGNDVRVRRPRRRVRGVHQRHGHSRREPSETRALDNGGDVHVDDVGDNIHGANAPVSATGDEQKRGVDKERNRK